VSPLPALLFTIVRSRAPCAISASISAAGIPAAPKPPIMTVAPSWMPATASATEATVLSIMADGRRTAGCGRGNRFARIA